MLSCVVTTEIMSYFIPQNFGSKPPVMITGALKCLNQMRIVILGSDLTHAPVSIRNVHVRLMEEY